MVSQSPAIYASPNAGSGIGVTATLQPSDFTLGSGTTLSNYSFNSTVTGTGTINPAADGNWRIVPEAARKEIEAQALAEERLRNETDVPRR